MSCSQNLIESFVSTQYNRGTHETGQAKPGEKKFVYLLDPQDGLSTGKFAEEFKYFVDQSIEFHHVKSSKEIFKDYPIALLLRGLTDNVEENIQSILKNIHKDLYKRTALINIHVVSNKCFLPKVPSSEKAGKFQDLGIILDFGLVDGKICRFDMRRTNSKQAFEDFIRESVILKKDKVFQTATSILPPKKEDSQQKLGNNTTDPGTSDKNKSVYLLDPQGGFSTETFAIGFSDIVNQSIEFECIKSSEEICKDYPIALLLRPPTDRVEYDIQSVLKHIRKDLYARTALIIIHVVSSKCFLPRVPTAEKAGKYRDLGIILDFGLIDGKICTFEMGRRNSKQAFEDFVRDKSVPTVSRSSLSEATISMSSSSQKEIGINGTDSEKFDEKKTVYLLYPQDGLLTSTFATEFQNCVDQSIKFDCVESSDKICKGYPIALLLRRQTDRAEEDIQSILGNIREGLYGRTALINIHVVSSKCFLPKVPTAEKVSKFQDLGIILDFGLVDGKICTCDMGRKDSKQAFEDFVRESVILNKTSNAVLRRSDSNVL